MSILIGIVRSFQFTYFKRVGSCFVSSATVNVIKSGRSFHNNTKLCHKMFMEHENQYAYNVMNKKGYAMPLYSSVDTEQLPLTTKEFDSIIQVDWSKRKLNEIIDLFSKLGTYCSQNDLCISNKIFDTFIDNLTDKIRHASDQELESLFYAASNLPETESIRTRNYIEVWAALDDECLNRLQKWSYDEALKFTTLFFMLNVTRVSDFSQKAIQKLASKAKQLTPAQLVQTLFYIGILRRSPFDMHNLELELDKRFTEFSIDDLAIMSMGFFKSKTPIRKCQLVSKIINKVMENAKEVNEVSLAALLKIIRYSLKISKDNEIYKLLNILQHEVPRLSVMCNVHLALLGTATYTLHEDCLNNIAEIANNCIAEARLKDLERLVLTFGIFQLKPKNKECFFEKVMNELRKPERHSEIKTHGRAYACCIAFLNLSGIYPVDLMSRVLSSEFLEMVYGKHCAGYGKEVLTIHTTAAIFCPEANMNRLTDKCAILMAKKFTDYVPNEHRAKNFNFTDSMFLDIKKILIEERGGDEYVLTDHVLPHHQKGDIIICNDHKGSPLKIPDNVRHNLFGLARRVPDANKWIVLVVAGRNGFILNTDAPTGPYVSKIKELKALGYRAALVKWSTFQSFTTNEDKLNYISNLITGEAQNK